MAHDIFISYSHHDKPTADAICAKLESEGLRCWYAPRDIAPGEDWAAAIIDGIKAAKVFVLVFTGYSNGSQQVLREIGAAVTQGLPIIPFKMTETLPSKGMQYYLSTVHWLDAVDGQLYKNIDILGKRIRAVLGAEGQQAEGPSSESGFSSVSDAEEQRHQGRNSRKGINIAVAVLVLVLAAVILWQAGVFGGKAPEGATVPDTVQETDTEQKPEATQAAEFTAEPTEEISEQPTETPSEVPTDVPTEEPTEELTDAPTEVPTDMPTEASTKAPAEALVQNDYPELRDLTEKKKEMITRLIIAGDRVFINFKYDDFNTPSRPASPEPIVYLSGESNEKQIETGPGTLADLSLLEGMDHLDTLWLLDQPLRSLDGIEKLQELTEVRICACKNLEDISALLQLENLGKLDLISSRQKAVGSIEKLKKLTDLYIIDYEMKDLGGLSDWNTAFAAEEKGVDLRLECPLVSDYSFLSKIPEFRRLQLRKADFAAWINETGHAGIHQLDALACLKTQEDFEAFVDILIREHPEVTRLELRYNEAITDLSSLLKLPDLTYVNVSSEMWNAISSLDEKDYKFELDVFD